MSENKCNNFNRQFIYICPEQVFFDNSLTDTDRRIYMIIRSFMDTTGDAYPSNNWISKKLSIDRRTVIKSINHLIEKFYLERLLVKGRRHLRIKISSVPDIIDDNSSENGPLNPDTEIQFDQNTDLPPPVVEMSPPSGENVTPPVNKRSPNYNNNNYKKDNNNIYKAARVNEQNSSNDLQVGFQLANPETEAFKFFWGIYPNKKNRLKCLALWGVMKLEEISETIISKLKLQVETDAQWRAGYAPNSDNYLKWQRWEDEIDLDPIFKSKHIKNFNKENSDKNYNQLLEAQEKQAQQRKLSSPKSNIQKSKPPMRLGTFLQGILA